MGTRIKLNQSRFLFAFVLSAAVVLATTSTALASFIVVDLKTNYLPGSEFTAARATLSPGGTQAQPLFTTSDVDVGVRIAEFDGLSSGTYHLVVDLFRSDESILDTRTVIIDLSENLAVTVVMARTGSPGPSCEDQLANAETELATTQAQLAASETALAEAETSLSAALSRLAEMQGELDTCDATLVSTSADLAVCDARLASLEEDPDGDGAIAILDQCPGTPAGHAVDASGCSNNQFCARITIATGSDQLLCRRADWRGDEASAVQPNDCTVREHACVATE